MDGYNDQRQGRLYDALGEYLDHNDTEALLKDIREFIVEQTRYHQEQISSLTFFSDHIK
jgi:hypothetical protein